MKRRRALAASALAVLLGCAEGHPLPVDFGGPADAALPPGAVRFAVIGDYGNHSDNELHVADLVKSWRPDFIITVGDNNYPSGDRSSIDANIGQFYARYIGGYTGRYGPGSPDGNRFWPAVGNHEFYGPEKGAPYFDYFPELPGNRRYYDVEIGLVHLFAVDSDDTEPDGDTAGSPQGQWLRNRLASHIDACFKVVYFHHPPISSGVFGVPRMRWPFAAWGADVVIAGHDHTYERLLVDGIPYFIDGLGGTDRFNFANNPPESQFKYRDDFGAMLVTATRDGISYEFWNVQNQLIDALTVPKACR